MNDSKMPREAGPGIDAWGAALGMEILEATGERVEARVVAGAQHHQPYGIVHGGVYCSIVEGVASIGAAMSVVGSGRAGVVGVSNSTDFLRSHSTGELRAVGLPLHQGRSYEIWEVVIRRASDAKPVARGQVRLHVLQELPAARNGHAAR